MFRLMQSQDTSKTSQVTASQQTVFEGSNGGNQIQQGQDSGEANGMGLAKAWSDYLYRIYFYFVHQEFLH